MLLLLATAAQVRAQVFQCTFDQPSDFDRFTVIDSNNDAIQANYFKWGTWDYMYRDLSYSPYGDDFPIQCAAYTNSEDNNGDDWLITPAIRLKGGTTYELKYKVRAHRERNTERMEVCLGQSANAAAMTTVVAPAEDFNNTVYEEQTHTLKPETDGAYYIGFHALSTIDDMILYLDDISLTATGASAAPDSVAALSIEPDATGALNATVNFTMPTLDTDGAALTSIDGVRIYRDSVEIANKTDVVVGSTVSYVDRGATAAPGYVRYSVVPYNNNGDGRRATAQAWVGLDEPAQPEGVTVKVVNDGLQVSWHASKPVHGGVFFADQVDYSIGLMEDEATLYRNVQTVHGDTTATLLAQTETGAQGLLLLGVSGRNTTGASAYAVGNSVVVGAPYSSPFHETFAAKGNSYGFWYFGGDGLGYSSNFASAGTTLDEDANGDGGAAELHTYYNDSLVVVSGKISLTGTTSPVLAFSQKTQTTTGSVVAFAVKPDGSVTTLSTESLAGNTDGGKWAFRSFPLSQFKDEPYIRVGIAFCQRGVVYKDNALYVDNVFVGDLPATDMAVRIETPKKLRKGREAQLSAVVSNYGSAASGYRLILKEGEMVIVDSVLTEQLAPFSYQRLSFAYVPDKLSEATASTVAATVMADGDANSDNDTEQVNVQLTNAKVPGIVDLNADATNGTSVALSWTPESRKGRTTEDFEDYDTWSISNIGDWSFIDADSGRTAGYFDTQRVYYDNERTPFAYIVWSPTNYGGYDITGDNPTVKPYSGVNALASVYSYRRIDATGELVPLNADNWLISPELTGHAQTISLRVNNFGEARPENYEVLYSTTGKEQVDFTMLESRTCSDASWDEVSFNLPEGTRYFAVRHNTPVVASETGIGYASSPYLFMVDDVSFEPMSLVFDHYNVYRDGQLIGTATEQSFTDPSPLADNEQHLYQVTAAYADGTESAPLGVSLSVVNGISSITDASVDNGPTYTIDGKRVGTKYSKPKGVYIIGHKKVEMR